MEKTDADLLHQLFRENNELRTKSHALQRDLFNKGVQLDNAEDEVRQLKTKIETTDKDAGTNALNSSDASKLRVGSKGGKAAAPASTRVNSGSLSNVGGFSSKELDEALAALDKKTNEVKHFKDELAKTQTALNEQKNHSAQVERELDESNEELQALRVFKEDTARRLEEEAAARELEAARPEINISDEIVDLKIKLETSEIINDDMKKQIIEIATEANRKHNEQQNQLQGVEALIERIRREYDEFILVAKLEAEAYRSSQQQEYDNLKKTFEQHKKDQLDEKRMLMTEYQGLLYSMQSQFDEYRLTSEFLFNTELARVEDELALQAMRYEQEIMYIIHAKDKFYTEMMVSKDAKIMSLIEGSDLQSIMQKNEMDLDALRKEHARDIERVKTDQESEQKNLLSMLQRQNSSLESKCEKLQTHMKSLESRIKELMGGLESKNKQLTERDEHHSRVEYDLNKKLEEADIKVNTLSQEKEHLRHKIIRINMEARGDGQNTIENMLKRVSRETHELQSEYATLTNKYTDVLNENATLLKQFKERSKLAEFLEKEAKRRSEEFDKMTKTFEEFLASRAKQIRRERAQRLVKMHDDNQKAQHGGAFEARQPESISVAGSSPRKGTPQAFKVHVPESDKDSPRKSIEKNVLPGDHNQRAEIDRGYNYLRRFKTLSRAFATGEFRALATKQEGQKDMEAVSGPWNQFSLYRKLDDVVSKDTAKLYAETSKESVYKEMLATKPLVYVPPIEKTPATKLKALKEFRLFDGEMTVLENTKESALFSIHPPLPKKETEQQRLQKLTIVGGEMFK